MIPPKTAISIRLRTIPQSTGLSRASHHNPLRAVRFGHYIKRKPLPIEGTQFTIKPDRELEQEIKRYKEAQQ